MTSNEPFTREIFIKKMSQYVAFLHRQAAVWSWDDRQDLVDMFMEKVSTVRDVCAMFGCSAEVWRGALDIYDWRSRGDSNLIIDDLVGLDDSPD